MAEVIHFFKHLIDAEYLIQYGGIGLLAFAIFAETGLFFGFLFPGDSLLLISGIMCNSPYLRIHILLLIFILIIAAILGNIVGYFFGKRVGETLYNKPDTFFFKKKYIVNTANFYAKYGGKTIIIGRFIPFIRTFAPMLAGVVGIDFKKFMVYNIIGAILWITSCLLLSYTLGKYFPDIKNYLHYIVGAIILLSAIPPLAIILNPKIANKNKKVPQA